MKPVPFYSNTADNSHCYEAVLKMILKYYFPKKDYSWNELDKMTGEKLGLYTWPQRAYIAMGEMGFKVKIISTFDYDRFVEDGLDYIKEGYGEEVAEKQRKNSDIEYERNNIKALRHLIEREKRIPECQDIVRLLSDDYIVKCGINSSRLAGQNGYTSHSILIIGSEIESFILHDPGLPPKESQKISFDIFNQAWAYPNDKAKDIAAFKLEKENLKT